MPDCNIFLVSTSQIEEYLEEALSVSNEVRTEWTDTITLETLDKLDKQPIRYE